MGQPYARPHARAGRRAPRPLNGSSLGAPVAWRAARGVLAVGLLAACRDEVTVPRLQPRAAAPMLSVAASTDVPGPIVQLPWLAGYGVQTSLTYDVNGRGDVVGWTYTYSTANGAKDDTYRATVWPGDGGPPRALIPLGGVDEPGVTHTEAYAINNLGDVVGVTWSDDAARLRATLWPAGGGPARELGTFDGADSEPLDINDRGDVVGSIGNTRAILWPAGGGPPRDLGPGLAHAINERGDIVGLTRSGTTLWPADGGAIRNLAALGGTYTQTWPKSINDRGDVVGYSFAPGGHAYRATLWLADGGPPRDLGTLGDAYPNSQAFGINDRGDIVGVSFADFRSPRATLWPSAGGPPVDLGVLSGGSRSRAVSISTSGFVAGYGSSATSYHDPSDGGGPMDVGIRWGEGTANDGEAPALSVPADFTREAVLPGGAKVKYAATASDNIGVTSLSCTLKSGTWFPIGTNTVSCVAIDAAGNQTSRGFVVKILGAPEQLTKLINIVKGAKVPSSYAAYLLDIVANVLAHVSSMPADAVDACKGLDVFIAEVRGNTATLIPAEKARRMIADARQIQDVIGCRLPLTVLRFSAPTSIVEGSDYTIIISGSDALGDRASLVYAFDCGLGDGYGAWSSTVNSVTCPVQLDQRPEPITVRGKVRDKDGAEREYQREVAVTNARPVATFAAMTPATISAGQSVTFHGAFTDAGLDDGPWTWRVVWGDNTPSGKGDVPTQGDLGPIVHTYARPGSYEAYLKVSDKDGKESYAAKVTITVLQRETATLVLRPQGTGFTTANGLSMQTNVGVQLEVWPATTVTWSSSDPSFTKASMNTTGLVVIRQGNEDLNTANEVVITATGADAVGTIQINSFNFDHFPRTMTLIWRPVTGAARYDVTIENGNGVELGCGGVPARCTQWSPSRWTTVPATTTDPITGSRQILHWYSFDFVGKQPGRWRVVAKDAAGSVLSTSEDVYFNFLR
jgi:hypothetical protein